MKKQTKSYESGSAVAAVLLLAVLVGGLFVGLNLINVKQIFQSRASRANASLGFPSSKTVTVNQEFEVPVILETGGEEIVAADIVASFDKNSLQLMDIAEKPHANNKLTTLIPRNGSFDKNRVIANANSTGTIDFGVVCFGAGGCPEGQKQDLGESNPLVSFKFKALKVATIQLSILYSPTLTTNSNLVTRAKQNVLGKVTPLSITVTSEQQNTTVSDRDAKRKSDIDLIANVLERYKSRKGYYPQIPVAWSSHIPGKHSLRDWIQLGDELAPEIQSLPVDPLNIDSTDCTTNPSCHLYHYCSDSNGSYFIVAVNLEGSSAQPEPDRAKCPTGASGLGNYYWKSNQPSTPPQTASSPATTLTLSKTSGFVSGETITLNFSSSGGSGSTTIHTSVWEGITDPSQKTDCKTCYQGFSGNTGQRTAKVPFYVEYLAIDSKGNRETTKTSLVTAATAASSSYSISGTMYVGTTPYTGGFAVGSNEGGSISNGNSSGNFSVTGLPATPSNRSYYQLSFAVPSGYKVTNANLAGWSCGGAQGVACSGPILYGSVTLDSLKASPNLTGVNITLEHYP